MLNLRAVWTGFLIDLGATFTLTAAAITIFFDPGSASVPMADCLRGTGVMETSLMALGVLSTMLGAFTAARMSFGREAVHSGAVGACSFIFSIWSSGGAQALHDPYFAFGLSMLFPAAFMGGALASLTRLRES